MAITGEAFYKLTNVPLIATSFDDLIFVDSPAALGTLSSELNSVNGDSGVDTLRIIATAAGSFVIHDGIMNVEIIEIAMSLGDTNTLETPVKRGYVAGITVDASAQSAPLTILGNDAANIIISGAAADLIKGNGGDDLLVITGTDDISLNSSNDTLDGGDGYDKLVVGMTSGKTFTIPVDAPLTNVEEIMLGAVLSGKVISDKTDVKLDASAYAKAVILTGNSGANIIMGGTEADTITGGPGADTLIGGSGNDIFVYGLATDLAKGENIDGGAGTDTLLLQGAYSYKFDTVT
ncbi:MAG: calcium-binding protein, partial [Methylococcaceae bacterium]